jgi:hypothetical protein
MKIVKATEPITVEHPVFLIFGQPGIGKSSIGYSAADPLLLDADRGAHRAVNRRDTLIVEAWKDIADITDSAETLEPYKTIVPDTVGRVLDLLAVQLIAENPKNGRGDGSLTLPGFGALKSRFASWLTKLRTHGKDVVLLAHAKEDKDGDSMIWRPDMTGASYGELMKQADFVGFLYMRGRDRVLDFSPTDRWVGKNPASWQPFVIPPAAKATAFLSGLMVQGRDALGAISDESAEVMRQLDTWREQIGGYTTAEQCNAAIPVIKALPPILMPQVTTVLMQHATTTGIPFDKKARKFTDPVKAAQPEPAESLL